MGNCNSTKINSREKNKDDMELNYDEYLDELRNEKDQDREVPDFEIVGKLIEFHKLKDKETPIERKYSKYFFINPFSGKIRSKVKSKLGDLDVEGFIERKGKFKISIKINCAGNMIEKSFEGQLICSEVSIEGKGAVNKININGDISSQEDYSFLLDFSTDIWRGNYTYRNNIVDIKAFMKIRSVNDSKALSGLSIDERGVSLWQGIIQTDNKVVLLQSYIGRDIKPKSITYGGTYNASMNLINGTIMDRDGEPDKITTYSLTLQKNPKKASVKY